MRTNAPTAVVPSGDRVAEELRRLLAPVPFSAAPADLAEYMSDSWPIGIKRRLDGQPMTTPVGVVRPRVTQDVVRALQVASRQGIAVVPRGGGSSVVGGAMPTPGCLIMDMTGMSQVLFFDEDSAVVTVQAGINGGVLERLLNARGYTLGHYPQSLEISTVGGWVATRASGTFSAKYGSIDDIVESVRVVLADGQTLDVGRSPRASAGPDLRQVFLGSEGTLGVIAEIALSARRLPESRAFRAYAFPSVERGLGAIRELVQSDLAPATVRLYDAADSDRFRGSAEIQSGHSILILGWDGPSAVVRVKEELTTGLLARFDGVDAGAELGQLWFETRFDVTAYSDGIRESGSLADTIDVSMPWSEALATYQDVTSAIQELGIDVLGHFSHVYRTGTSLYLTLFMHGDTHEDIEALHLAAWSRVMSIVLRHRGSISHHHGIGLIRAPWLGEQLGCSSQVLRVLKQGLDPKGILNPGKLLAD